MTLNGDGGFRPLCECNQRSCRTLLPADAVEFAGGGSDELFAVLPSHVTASQEVVETRDGWVAVRAKEA